MGLLVGPDLHPRRDRRDPDFSSISAAWSERTSCPPCAGFSLSVDAERGRRPVIHAPGHGPWLGQTRPFPKTHWNCWVHSCRVSAFDTGTQRAQARPALACLSDRPPRLGFWVGSPLVAGREVGSKALPGVEPLPCRGGSAEAGFGRGCPASVCDLQRNGTRGSTMPSRAAPMILWAGHRTCLSREDREAS